MHRADAPLAERCNTGLNDYAAGMRVILIRHYKTQSNKEGRILGWSDSPPIAGWKTNVTYIESQLRANGLGFDAVYASDLERSRRTARVLASDFAVDDVFIAPALKEINYGEMQTRRKSWVAEHYPLHKKDPDMVYRGGESFRQMQQRSVEYVTSLLTTQPGKTILVVSHAGVIRGLICHFLGLDYAHCLKHGIPFRYIGDFRFDGTKCLHYDELGKHSGYVRNGAIDVPWTAAEVGG